MNVIALRLLKKITLELPVSLSEKRMPLGTVFLPVNQVMALEVSKWSVGRKGEPVRQKKIQIISF